jgi:phage FluMu gp28-like protein
MNITLFTPYELQRRFIQAFSDTDDLFGVVSAPRGSGKTILGINLMLYWLLQKPNQRGGWISPVYSQAKSVLDTMVNTSTEVIESSNRMEATIQFINGSTLKFLSADSADNIRGYRFTHLVIDEMAFVKENVLNSSILPTLNPSGKKCLMISTPKGKNHFFNWYNKEDTVSIKFPLRECPYVSSVLIEEARKSLPPDIFKQEFEAEFVDSSNDVFVGVDKVSTVNLFSVEKKVDVYIGIDTGLTDDMSVLTCISPIGRVIWVEHINNVPINRIATIFSDVLTSFNVVGGYVECNGIGKAMADLLIPKFPKVREFYMTQDRKQDVVRKLINDIENMNIELPTRELLPQLHDEFSTYTYKMSPSGKLSFSHSPGNHDDFVDSLMLANYSRVQFMERRPMTIRRHTNIKPDFGRGVV